MRKSTSKIITVALVMIAAVSAITALPDKKKHNTQNVLLNAPEVNESESFEVSIETLPSDIVAGTLDGTTEAPTEEMTEVPTEAPTEAPTEPPTEAPTVPPTEAPTMPPTEAPTVPPTQAPVVSQPKQWKYLYVGDSRFLGMRDALVKYGLSKWNEKFICENGGGYSFFIANMQAIKEYCDSSTVLVVSLGINDMKYRADQYIATLNEMVATMDCQIYYMLINPVNQAMVDAGGKFNADTSDILAFNVKMMNGLDKRINIIDCYSYLVNEVVNFETFDGVHYTYDTSMIIYNYIQRFIP